MVTQRLTKAEAGRLGAEARWASYVPNVVRIGELTPPQRRLVLALVDAARAEFHPRNEKAAPVSETSGTAMPEVARDSHDPAA